MIKNSKSTTGDNISSTYLPIAVLQNSNFLRIGKGALGGKARGLAFLNENIYQKNIIENKVYY